MIYQPEKVEVYHDLVLVRRVDTQRTPGGIVVPHHPDKKESQIAKVVQVGPGIPNRPETKPQCSPGEYWIIARYIGTIIRIDDQDLTLVKWNDMQARLTFSGPALRLLDDSLAGDVNE